VHGMTKNETVLFSCHANAGLSFAPSPLGVENNKTQGFALGIQDNVSI